MSILNSCLLLRTILSTGTNRTCRVTTFIYKVRKIQMHMWALFRENDPGKAKRDKDKDSSYSAHSGFRRRERECFHFLWLFMSL